MAVFDTMTTAEWSPVKRGKLENLTKRVSAPPPFEPDVTPFSLLKHPTRVDADKKSAKHAIKCFIIYSTPSLITVKYCFNVYFPYTA